MNRLDSEATGPKAKARKPRREFTLDKRLLDPTFTESAERDLTVAVFREFLRQRLLRVLVKKTGIVEKESIFIFGQIEKEFQKIKNLLCFIPLNIDKAQLKALIERHISTLVEELCNLNLVDPEHKDVFEVNLHRLAYRNVTRNLRELYELEGAITPLPLDPETQDFSRFLNEPDLFMTSTQQEETDDPHSELSAGVFREVEEPTRKSISFRALIERAVQLDQEGTLGTVEKTGLLLEAASEEGHSNYNRLNAQLLKAFDFAYTYLTNLATELDEACNLVSQYVPDLNKPAIRGTIDIDVEKQTYYPTEILRILSFRTEPNLKTLDEMQLLAGIACQYLRVINSPYYRGAALLNRRLGRDIFSDPKLFIPQRSTRDIPLDERGNITTREKAVEVKQWEFRRARIATSRGMEDLDIYVPNKAIRPKEEASTVSKLIREPQLEVENTFDLWGGMMMVDHTTDELLNDPNLLEKVKIFARKLMENRGLKFVDKEKEKLKPGEFTLSIKLEKKNQGKKSNGFSAVKIYLRTKGSPETPRGIPGELQLLPRDTYEGKESPDNPVHSRFYDAKKLPLEVKHIFSGSVFPELHTQAAYVEEGIERFVKSRLAA